MAYERGPLTIFFREYPIEEVFITKIEPKTLNLFSGKRKPLIERKRMIVFFLKNNLKIFSKYIAMAYDRGRLTIYFREYPIEEVFIRKIEPKTLNLF